MKSILYVGATLMIGASIYGFVDYQKTSHKKEFKNMYNEQPVVAEPAKNAKMTATTETKKEATKEKNAVETKTSKTDVIAKTTPKETISVTQVRKRKFSTKLFSRGALDERYIKEEIKPEPVKTTESVKSEDKEQ